MNSPTTVYLAVLEDRHFDTSIIPCTTLAKALKRITDWQLGYDLSGGDYTWEEVEIKGWEYYVKCHSDGPTMRVERKTLE